MSTLVVSEKNLKNLAAYLEKCKEGSCTVTLETFDESEHILSRHGFAPDGHDFALCLYKFNVIAYEGHYGNRRGWDETYEVAVRRWLNCGEICTISIFQALKTLQCYEYNISDIDGYELYCFLTQYEKGEYERTMKCLKRLISGIAEHIVQFDSRYEEAQWG